MAPAAGEIKGNIDEVDEENTDSSTSTLPDADTQKKLVKESQENYGKTLGAVGDVWYLICSKWWKTWKVYTGYTESYGNSYSNGYSSSRRFPGPITNEDLLDSASSSEDYLAIRKHAMEHYDFELIPSETWSLLHSWYGGTPIPRYVVSNTTSYSSSKFVEVRLCCYTLKCSESTEVKKLYISKTATIGQLKEKAALLMGVDKSQMRFWDIMNGSKYAELTDNSMKIPDAKLLDDQDIYLEDSTKPVDPMKDPYRARTTYSSYNNSSSYYNNYNTNSGFGGRPEVTGAVGLSNLGNTCFMNSALQCLSATTLLTTYFLEDAYETEINKDNPLGTKGELVRAYASLVKSLWSDEHSVVSPRQFKFVLGQHAEQFVGYDQHDSQELIAYLLDMIHEDVNRVKTKPFVEKVEANQNETDADAAKRAWDAHLLRNNSIVVETFQGQYKSVVTCPDCGKVSVTFDPFMYLTLPLPVSTDRFIPVIYSSKDGSGYIQYSLNVAKSATVKALKKVLAAKVECSSEDLIICDIYSNKVYEVLKDNKTVDTIRDNDRLIAYRLPTEVRPAASKEEVLGISEWSELLKSFLLHEEDLDSLLEQNATEEQKQTFLSKLKRCESRCMEGKEYEIEGTVSAYYRNMIKGITDFASLKRFSEAVSYFERWIREQTGRKFVQITHQKRYTTPYTSSYGGTWQPFGDPIVTAYFPNYTTVGQFKMEVATGLLHVIKYCSQDFINGSSEKCQAAEIEVAIEILENHLQIMTKDRYGYGDTKALFKTGYQQEQSSAWPADSDLIHQHIAGVECLSLCWDKETYGRFYDEGRAQNAAAEPSSQGQNKRKKDALTLNDCLQQFLKQEQLEETEMWYCSQCKEHRQAWKQFYLWRLPPVLVIHMKRFGSVSFGCREKLENFVECPVRGLDLTQVALDDSQPRAIYDLYAISNHYGGLGGGHYTAFAFNKNAGKWFEFDDSSVKESDESSIVTCANYVLFYMRRDASEPARNIASRIPQRDSEGSGESTSEDNC